MNQNTPGNMPEQLHTVLQEIYKHGWDQKGDQWEMVNKAESLIQADKEAAIREVGERIKKKQPEIGVAPLEFNAGYRMCVSDIDEIITTYLAEGK